jgi:prepilin-type N-terminal cleavage/methylation domain-containing protein
MTHSFFVSSHPRKAFTLIELLVVIAIVAILAVVVVLTLNPAQLLAQSRDANRVSDMATLNSALNLYTVDAGGTGSLGTSSIVYTSLSDTSSTCGNLGLPALPASSTYNCAVSTSSRNINTTGWIPVNFQNISSGAPFGSLPIDPVNTSSSGLYYTYSTNGSQFEVTALPESQKQKLSLAQNPLIPNYPDVIANGSNLTISPLFNPVGIVGWWKFNEGSGTIAYDASGNGNTGNLTLVNTPTWISGKLGGGLSFNGSANEYVDVPATTSLATYSSYTVMLWANIQTNSQVGLMQRLGWMDSLCINSSGGHSKAHFYVWNPGGGEIGSVLGTLNISNGTWHLIAGTFQASKSQLFLDGMLDNSSTPSASPSAFSDLHIGQGCGGSGTEMNGSIADVRIYNRALSAGEIQALYNAGK